MPVGHAAAHEHRRDDVEVEEAPVVRDADVALRRVELREALEAVEVPEVLRALVDPAGADRPLAPAQGLVDGAGLEAPANQADLRLLDRLERRPADRDEVRALGGRFGPSRGGFEVGGCFQGDSRCHGRAT